MLRPDPTGARSSNSVKPDSWKLGPELVHRFESDDQTRVAIDPADSEPQPEIRLAAGQQDFAGRRRDFRTGALTAAIIALSLLLGWMVGRAGWSMAVERAEIQSPGVPENLSAAQVVPEPLPVSSGTPSGMACLIVGSRATMAPARWAFRV